MTDHGRSKYKREVHCLESPYRCIIDVYSVLEAFAVTCPARQHLIKKILCTGIRGKGGSLQDLEEAKVALDRAIVLEKERLKKKELASPSETFTDKPGKDVTTMDVVATLEKQQWRIYQVLDDKNVPIGYRVGWDCGNGRTFMVGHYMAAEDPVQGPSLTWCEIAAESHVKRLNSEGKRPEEFGAFRFLESQSKEETKKDV